MIQNCLIRREIAKKNFGGSRRFSAAAGVPPPFFRFSLWQHSILRIFLKNQIIKHYVSRVLPLKQPKKRLTAEPAAVSRYFFNFFFNLGKIDLPRSIHTNFQSEIRILSAIRALFTKGPPSFSETIFFRLLFSRFLAASL